jgi:metal-responsive CopG/Arc/MetJ family transcriptional regulator
MNSSIKVKKDLLERIERYATAAGYSSPQEFVEHIIERELGKLEDAQSDEEIARKLKGLGYID